jgi:hypothetical protein
LIQGWAMFGGFGIASDGRKAREERAPAPELIVAS